MTENMQPYDHALNQILSNDSVKTQLFYGRLDSDIEAGKRRLREAFREIEWAKKAIVEPSCKGLYRADKSDEQIYNEAQEIKRSKIGKMDANDGLAFSRELSFIDPREFNVKHKPLGTWRDVLPIQTLPLGLEYVKYRVYDQTGEAILSDNKDTSISYVDATAQEYTNKVLTHKSGYKLSFEDLRNAAFSGAPLEKQKIYAVSLAFEKSLQKSMFLGVFTDGGASVGTNGFLNHPSVPNNPSSGTFATLGATSPDAVIAEIVGMPNRIMSDYDTAFGEGNYIICLPVAQYNYIYSTPRSINSDTSIAAWILQNYPMIERFMRIPDLKGQGTVVESEATDLAICYQRDPMYLEAQVLDSIIWHPPQFDDLAIKFPAEMKYGGVAVRYPLSMTQLYGI
jgi:hypothetical protein